MIEQTQQDQIAALRQKTSEVLAEPFDPVAAFYADAPPLPSRGAMVPTRIVDTGGYPIEDFNRFLREEADHFQSLSGEEPQC